MIPGPIEVDSEVLAQMSTPLIAHYGPEWVPFYQETVQLAKRVFCAEQSDLFFMPGPGSLAVEAAISSLASDGSKILVLTNGFFGDRWLKVVRTYTKQVIAIEVPWGEPIQPEAVRSTLKREAHTKAAIVVHGETSTGMVNPVKEIATICQEFGVLLIVDAVSTLGGVPLHVDNWGIDICATATQKCLECPPGLAPVSVSERAWHEIERCSSPGWYMNLRTWKEYAIRWGDWHPHPVTMPTGLMKALHYSCKKILAEGLDARFRRHAAMAQILRKGLSNLGFQLFIQDEEQRSNTFTAARCDERLSAPEMIRYLQTKHQIQIAGGLDQLAGRIFRIGHMGPTASLRAILPTLFAIEDALRDAGARLNQGICVQDLDLPVRLSNI
jgi:alanine-glyoxylate transaminase/serine-glyoxylate transaminase/serine-pyruvate transaminase